MHTKNYFLLPMLVIAALCAQRHLVVDERGNRVVGPNNEWDGSQNSIQGAQNRVKGDSNQIAGNNNQVQGNGNVVGSMSQEQLAALQKKMAQQLSSRFGNIFGLNIPSQAKTVLDPPPKQTTPATNTNSSREDIKNDPPVQKLEQKTVQDKQQPAPVNQSQQKAEINEQRKKEEQSKGGEQQKKGAEEEKVQKRSVSSSGLLFRSFGLAVPFRQDFLSGGCLKLGLCPPQRLTFSSVFPLFQ